MKKKKMPVPIKFLIAVMICINAAVVVGILFAGHHVVKTVKDAPPVESSEMHIIKTLPQFSDYDMWVFGFQDLTVYGKYYFKEQLTESDLENSGYFKKITEDNLIDIRAAVMDYETWVDFTKGNGGAFGDDISEVYDFDRLKLDPDGWWYYFETTVDTDVWESIDPDKVEYRSQSFNYYIYSEEDNTVYIMHHNT